MVKIMELIACLIKALTLYTINNEKDRPQLLLPFSARALQLSFKDRS